MLMSAAMQLGMYLPWCMMCTARRIFSVCILPHLQFEIQLGQWRNKLINLINAMVQYQPQEVNSILNGIRGGSRAAATSLGMLQQP